MGSDDAGINDDEQNFAEEHSAYDSKKYTDTESDVNEDQDRQHHIFYLQVIMFSKVTW